MLQDTFISSYGVYLTHFLEISTFRGDDKWAGAWMLFFFGWFIGRRNECINNKTARPY
jgi:glycine betaine transporter